MSDVVYAGPARHEPLAVELHNTLYVAGGEQIDGLATGASTRAWLSAIRDRLPLTGNAHVSREELIALRSVIRASLHALLAGHTPSRSDLHAINRASARAPQSALARWRRQAFPVRATDVHGASASDVILAAIATDAIDLITSSRLTGLRACGAPGCVLLFVKDHPRREWCSAACGNRARQARHYARTKDRLRPT